MAGSGATVSALLVVVASFTSWQAPVQANYVSTVLQALGKVRQTAPIYVSIYNRVGGSGSSNNLGPIGHFPGVLGKASSCLPSQCQIACPLGFAKNAKGCPICKCKSDIGKKASLNVLKRTVTGTCSMVAQKAASKGRTSLKVESCTPFTKASNAVIHQTQRASGGSAGVFEFVDIQKCSGQRLHLRRPLRHTFFSQSTGGKSPQVAQVVPVIQAVSITVCEGGQIRAPDWDGKCGGIIAIQAKGDVKVCDDSKISATGAGFRGAPRFISQRNYAYGYIGESEAVGFEVRRQSAGVGSGGGAGRGNGGGYGGAHKTFGSAPSRGGCSRGSAGKPQVRLASNSKDKVYFGGSGGASGSNSEGLAGRFGAKGGKGGGVVFMIAGGSIKASPGSVQANGLPGQDGFLIQPSRKQAMGGGGGGAGGTVAYKMGSHKSNNLIPSVSGGAGGKGLVARSCGSSGHGGSGGKGTVFQLSYKA